MYSFFRLKYKEPSIKGDAFDSSRTRTGLGSNWWYEWQVGLGSTLKNNLNIGLTTFNIHLHYCTTNDLAFTLFALFEFQVLPNKKGWLLLAALQLFLWINNVK